MTTCLLSLGSNLGNCIDTLNSAINDIKSLKGVEDVVCASMYQTKPVGYLEQDDFINTALKIKTSLEPFILLDNLQALEQKYKRVRLFKYGPRTLDIDIIAYGNVCQEDKRLILPHPRMAQRAFVLVPLNEIASDFVFASLNKDVATLLNELPQSELDGVRKLNG